MQVHWELFLSNQEQIDMQRYLDALIDCGSTWIKKSNAKNCNIIRVSRSRKPLPHFYSLGNEILHDVFDAQYLGKQIDNKLDWNKNISTVAPRFQSKSHKQKSNKDKIEKVS